MTGPNHESEPVHIVNEDDTCPMCDWRIEILDNANAEIERLRALIDEWDDAEREYFGTPLLRRGRARAALTRATLARIALRRAVNR